MVNKKKEYYYYDYIKDKSEYFDLLHNEFDKRFYYFGDHFSNNYERRKTLHFYAMTVLELFVFTFNKIRYYGRDSNDKVVSNCYFGFKDELTKIGWNNYSVPWVVNLQPSIVSFKDFLFIQSIKVKLFSYSFNELLDKKMHSDIMKVEEILANCYRSADLAGIFLSNDVSFFDRLTISIAKKLNIKTFILMHGAAPRYVNTENDSRSDYYLVFGESYQKRFIESGYTKSKIIVVGHPVYSYQSDKLKKPLRFDLDNILVLSKTIPGQHLQYIASAEGRARDTMRFSDRGAPVLYLLKIQQALQQLEVKSVRLRLHPSENITWYKNLIDNEFFIFDRLDLTTSMQLATLVIGPTSSTFIDATFSNVNYLIFEPDYDDGVDMLNQGLGYPFDGSEPRLPVAKNEEDLINLIKLRKGNDVSVFHELIKDQFDLNEVNGVLKKASL